MSIKDFVYSLKNVWDTANKPKWQDVKNITYITLLMFALVGALSMLLFVFVQSLLMYNYIVFNYEYIILAISAIILSILIYLSFKS